MSSTDYSYFNLNNYNSPFPLLTDLWSDSTVDLRMLPLYSVNGSQLMTYFFVAITAITLGYVTITEETFENSPPPSPEEEPKIGGKKKKSKTYKKYKK